MTKVLGIMGSPRKNGNTHILMNKILEGAKSAGASTELVLIADLDIAPCDGCEICFQGKPCKIEDDMLGLYDKLVEADTIVFGSPVYWYGPSAQMKTFFDRFMYFSAPENMQLIEGKNAVIATVYEEESPYVAEALVMMFERSFNLLKINLVNKIIVADVLNKGDINKKTDSLERASELGASLARLS